MEFWLLVSFILFILFPSISAPLACTVSLESLAHLPSPVISNFTSFPGVESKHACADTRTEGKLAYVTIFSTSGDE